MTKLTTHALDTYSGKPAKGMKVDVYFIADKREKIKTIVLNKDGRPEEDLVDTLKVGNYETEHLHLTQLGNNIFDSGYHSSLKS